MSRRLLGSVLVVLSLWGTVRGQEASSPFPSVAGWVMTPDTAVYTPDNLYDLIDGAADVYLSYGFVDLHLADYRRSDGTEVRVEVYHHSTPANAFGIYSQERKPDYHFIPVGVQGYKDEGVLNFLAGPYYVKISTHATGPGANQALAVIAQASAAHLRQDTAFPAPLRLFPPGGRSPTARPTSPTISWDIARSGGRMSPGTGAAPCSSSLWRIPRRRGRCSGAILRRSARRRTASRPPETSCVIPTTDLSA